ncbi:MAG: hypothetical protein HOQ03_03345 [Thermoleophilia bacterium]|nr:hypothetical protein [Thermoleophilia bacterium]
MAPVPPPAATAARRAAFSCRWRDEGHAAASVRAAGELDAATSRQLAGVLREALGSAQVLLLDVREVTFGDSRGVRAILDAAHV